VSRLDPALTMNLPVSARLRFRRITEDDHAALCEMFADPYARSIYPRMIDPAEVAKWISWTEDNYRRFGFGLWVIETLDGGFVGDCGLTWQAVGGKDVLEIGYHVTASKRNHGYALEAAAAVLSFGFETTREDRIYSIVSPANPASIAVAGKLHRHRADYMNADGVSKLLFHTERPLAGEAGNPRGHTVRLDNQ
jgi:RimJ/RimL family protein N-acetyltransferase